LAVALALCIILVTVFIIYTPSIHGGMLWDDDANLTKPQLREVDGLYRIWFEPAATAKDAQYYPLVHTMFWLEHKLWGDRYAGYHLANVLWHSISVVLVYFIVRKLQIPGALLAAAIFAVHPVMVESVAWMTEQKNTLSTVFYLGAMLSYLDFDASRRRSRYLLAVGLFVLALLSKSVTVTMPFALLVIFWWKRGTLSWRRDVFPLVPFFATAVAAGLMTIWVEWKLVGAEKEPLELTFLERFLLAGRDIWFYLGKLVWPTKLSFIYTRWNIDSSQWWQWTFSVAAIGTTIALWTIRKLWRGPLAAWLYFCGTLVPVLGFLDVYMFRFSFVADHLQYLASLGIIVLLSAGIAIAIQSASQYMRWVGITVCATSVGALGVLSWRQAHNYADLVNLYEATLELNPTSWRVHNNLGFELANRGLTQKAAEHYQAALRIKPNYTGAYNNLGLLLNNAGQYNEAIEQLRAALRIDPNYAEAHNNLGNSFTGTNRRQDAISEYREAVRLEPDFFEARYNLGLALMQMQHFPEAIQQFTHATQLQPDDPDGHNSLGSALDGSGRLSEAIDEYREAMKLNPNYGIAQFNLGDALMRSGRDAEAIGHLECAVRLKPDFLEGYVDLSQAFAAADRSNEAIAAAEKAIQIANSRGNRAIAEKVEEWLKHYRQEVRRSENAANSSPN
jgi:protein O-mannosyl-transferase